MAVAAALGARVRDVPADQPRAGGVVDADVDRHRALAALHRAAVDVRVDHVVPGGRPGDAAVRDPPVTHFVHGMGKEPAEPDWPPLTSAELTAALGGSVLGGSVFGGSPSPAVTWHSPRPLSAAALVELADGRTVFVKRHHQRVRSAAQLAAEHAFTAHLRAHGQPVPQVLATAQVGEWNYEF